MEAVLKYPGAKKPPGRMDNFFHSGTPGLPGIILWKWGGVFQ